MTDVVHLHVHTMYSLLDGLGKIDELCQRAKDLGMPAMAITDHGNMHGAVDFYLTAKKIGIKPIIGIEAYVAPQGIAHKEKRGEQSLYHLVLLARNEVGYHHLLRLTTKAHLEGFYYKPRLDKAWLREYGEGLIALSACLQGEIPRLLLTSGEDEAIKAVREYQEIFGQDNFYLEVERHEIEDQKRLNKILIPFARKYDLPLVAANDVHYIYPNDWEPQDALLCVQTGKVVSDTNRMRMTSHDFYVRSPDEMSQLFADIPDALENTVKVAEQCNLELEFHKELLPQPELPKGYTAETFMKHECALGLVRRYGIKTDDEFNLLGSPGESKVSTEKEEAILKRIKYETSIICQMGYDSYYLIVQDLVNHARETEIAIGPGRGSGAGSMAAYLMGITNLDPLDHHLLFERFLNPERASMPDFDLDFADARRDEMIAYTVDKYGSDHVAQIITFGSMMAKAAIRDVGRVLGMSYSDVDRIAKMIPMGLSLQESLDSVVELKLAYDKDPQVRKIIELASRLEGVARHASTHAAAVVLSKYPLVEDIPLQRDSREGKVTTQYSMKPCEEIGLLKIDFLGLRNLTILGNALKVIKEHRGLEIDFDTLPLDDSEVFDMLTRGETAGVFQVESSGMARLARDMRVENFDDIVALIALFRPGPMNMLGDFIDGKHGKKEPAYPHPILEPILKDSYGIAIYQEQVQQIACDFAGFSLGEGYLLIKAIGKKKIAEIKKMKTKFIKGAMERAGVDRKKAEEVFRFIEPFARYGFNKSHAACYGMLTYQTAYLKAKYPLEYMTAVLTSEMEDQDKLAKYIDECQRMEIKVLGPDINKSQIEFSVEEDAIRFGLKGVKNVGVAAIENIIASRQEAPFDSLTDFCCRISSRACNRKVLESLIKSGAMDDFGNRNQQLAALDNVLSLADKQQHAKDCGQTSLFEIAATDDFCPTLTLPEIDEVNLSEKLSWERELLGIYFSEHPLSMFSGQINSNGFITVQQAKEKKARTKVKVVGIVKSVKNIITKNKNPMAFATLEGENDEIELVVFPKVYQKSVALWEKDKILIVTGKLDYKDDEAKLLVDEATEFDETEKNHTSDSSLPNGYELAPEPQADASSRLVLSLSSRQSDTGNLLTLQEILAANPGENQVELVLHADTQNRKKIKLDVQVDLLETKILDQLANLFGSQVISFR